MKTLKEFLEKHCSVEHVGDEMYVHSNYIYVNVAVNYYLRYRFSKLKNQLKYQQECLEQCAKSIDPKSPLGKQIELTLLKTKGL